jgi:hypothetical protein
MKNWCDCLVLCCVALRKFTRPRNRHRRPQQRQQRQHAATTGNHRMRRLHTHGRDDPRVGANAPLDLLYRLFPILSTPHRGVLKIGTRRYGHVFIH